MKKLREYINSLSEEQKVVFAKKCKCSISHMRSYISSGRLLDSRTCVLIEAVSKDAVTRQDLIPDYWNVWPELGTPPKKRARAK